MDRLQVKYIFVFVLIIIAVALVLFDLQNTNIGFLQLHSIDEYSFHGSLRSMYSAFTDHKISHLFGYGFYQYGFIYFFVNLIATLPGLILHNSAYVIFIPRLLISLCALGSLVFVYKFARRYLGQWMGLLLAVLFVSMPAFWFNATWFHPDWVMTFFLLGSVYYLAKDEWKFGKYFYMAAGFFGLAVAFKYQAITATPLLLVYILYGQSHRIKSFLKSIGIVIGIFLVSNPYIFHPVGWKLFSGALIGNLQSNATNHGVASTVTLLDKLTSAIGDYYLNPLLFILLLGLSIWIIWRSFKNKEKNIFSVISINFIINLTYLLAFVNKAWQIYYLPVMLLGVLSLVYVLGKLSIRRQTLLISLILMIQLISQLHNYKNLNQPRDIQAPDFNDYTIEQNITLNDSIIKNLQNKVSSNDYVMITPYTPFEYEKLGLTFEHVKTIYGPLTSDAFSKEAYVEGQKRYWGDMKTAEELATTFKEIKYIILRKNIPFIDVAKIEKVADKEGYYRAVDVVAKLNDGTLGYTILAEDYELIIYKKK